MKNSELIKVQDFLKETFEKEKIITRDEIIEAIIKKQFKRRGFIPDIKTGEIIYIALSMGYKVKDYNLKRVKKWAKHCSEKQIYEKLRSNHSVKEISKITGESENQVKAKLYKHNIKRNVKDKFDKEQLKKDYKKMTLKEMQKKYKVSESTIYRYLKEYNIPRKTA